MKNIKLTSIILILYLFIVASSCSAENNTAQDTQTESKVFGEEEISDDISNAQLKRTANNTLAKNKKQMQKSMVDDLGGVGLIKMQGSQGRLLEYHVDLVYRTQDFFQARNDLLKITSRYGFILNSTTKSGETPLLHSKIKIKSVKLLDVLAQMHVLGKLESESIQTIDHTENWALQEQKIVREKTRQRRRIRGATNTGNKDWQNRERLLSQSEDREDESSHEQWKIQDRVSFAVVQISVHGPRQAPQVEIPIYKKALVDLVNFFLGMGYIVIYFLPLIFLIIACIYWIRKKRLDWKKEK